MLKFFFSSTVIFFFSYINFIICQTLSARRNAGCALIKNNIYCYGGMPLLNNQSLNVQHIKFDLQQLHGITNLDDSKIRWVMVPDVINSTQAIVKPRGYQASAVATSDNSYVMYGGVIRDYFLNYNPQSYTWRTLQVDPNVNLTNRNTVVNMGNDMFWLWGGENFPDFNKYLPNVANIYDYKAERWVNRIVEDDVTMRAEHTATLALDGGIYILGGTTRYPDGNFSYSNFNEVRKFDTKSSQWSYFNATGHIASPRVAHTATQLPNRNQILIYGGGNGDPKLMQAYNMVIPETHISYIAISSNDYYIIFDYSDNTFQRIDFSSFPYSKNSRYGHFSEIYNETYLVLTFGFIENNISASSISILNISDPFRPNWVTSFSNSSTIMLNDIDNGFRGNYIAAIVVPIVVLIAITVVLYFYKKRGKKYKFPKDPFVIDDSDPRLNIKKNEFNGAENAKYAKLTIDHEEEGYNKVHDNYPADAFCKPLGNATNMAGQNVEYIKPTEN